MLLKGLVLSFVSILQKHIDSLKEAFIDPRSHVRDVFITDTCTLFNVFWTVDKNTRLPH